MYAAYHAGEDLHAKTTRVLTGNAEVTKADLRAREHLDRTVSRHSGE